MSTVSKFIAAAVALVALTACGGDTASPAAGSSTASTAVSESVASAAQSAAAAAKTAVADAEATVDQAAAEIGEVLDDAGGAMAGAATEAAGATDLAAGEQTYNRFCLSCHAAGVAGAPKMGVAEDWAPRAAKGLDALVAASIEGVPPAMPARGLCMNCSDDDLRNTVAWMLTQQ